MHVTIGVGQGKYAARNRGSKELPLVVLRVTAPSGFEGIMMRAKRGGMSFFRGLLSAWLLWWGRLADVDRLNRVIRAQERLIKKNEVLIVSYRDHNAYLEFMVAELRLELNMAKLSSFSLEDRMDSEIESKVLKMPPATRTRGKRDP